VTEPDVIQKLTEIFSEIFRRDDLVLRPNTTANDVDGWDSFKQIEIAVAVEERFGIKLRTRDMSQLKNVGELVKLIASKLPR
jgi:acyl carrier protein